MKEVEENVMEEIKEKRIWLRWDKEKDGRWN